MRNAVMHRNYEGTNAPVRVYWFNDRIEVHSPGGPYGMVSASNFGQPGVCDYRNPAIAAALRTCSRFSRESPKCPFGMGCKARCAAHSRRQGQAPQRRRPPEGAFARPRMGREHVLKTMGFVQRFGFGNAHARRAMADNGNPPPEFLVDQWVAVTLRSAVP